MFSDADIFCGYYSGACLPPWGLGPVALTSWFSLSLLLVGGRFSPPPPSRPLVKASNSSPSCRGTNPLSRWQLPGVGCSRPRAWLTDCRSVNRESKHQGLVPASQPLFFSGMWLRVGWPERDFFQSPKRRLGQASCTSQRPERGPWMACSKGVPHSREFSEGAVGKRGRIKGSQEGALKYLRRTAAERPYKP